MRASSRIIGSKSSANSIVFNGLQVWADFSNTSSLSLSGSEIISASDLSGNNRSFSQYGSAPRPTIASAQSGFLSQQSAYFNTKALICPYLVSGSSARTVLMVAYVKTQTGFGHLLHSGTANTGQSWGLTPLNNQYSPNNSFGNHYWAFSTTSGINVIGSSYMLGMTYNGSTDFAIINQNRYTLSSSISTGTDTNFLLGSRIAGPFESATDSYIGEVLIYNRSITTDEQQTMYQYFKSKWGMPT